MRAIRHCSFVIGDWSFVIGFKDLLMYLNEPQPTAYDLRFRLLGTNVRVHPMFWLVSVFLNFRLLQGGRLDLLLIWIACVFVSIVLHEFGHVLMGRAFGSHAHIVLYGFGGLAVGSREGLRRWQRVLVLFAGPGAGFVLATVLVTGWLMIDPDGAVSAIRDELGLDDGTLAEELRRAFTRPPGPGALAVRYLLWINVFWGVLNLLPVWPLDGGQISGELLSAFSPRTGFRLALQISIGVAGGIALLGFAQWMGRPLLPFSIHLGLYGSLMFALLAYGSYELLQQTPRDPQHDDRWERTSWERDDWRR